MSDRIATRRQFLKGLGMVTGAFATGAFALKSSANEEGVVYNETPSGIPCFYWESWKADLKTDTSNPQTLYYYHYTGVAVCRNVKSKVDDYTSPQKTQPNAALELSNKKSQFQAACMC